MSITTWAQRSELELKFESYGLVDVSTLDSTIVVELKYATADNFTGKNMYGEIARAYFTPEIAKMVARAQKILKERYPDYGLIIYDAARPMSVQARMFAVVAGTPQYFYVANPKQGGGRHNYGIAVDLSIIDSHGYALDMGSPFDFFGEAAHAGKEKEMVTKGVITRQAMINRKILTDIMYEVGFVQHPKEWWHFHKYTMAQARAKFKLLDF